MGPLDVSASKSGAVLPKRRVGIFSQSALIRTEMGRQGDSRMLACFITKTSEGIETSLSLSLRLPHAMLIQMTQLHNKNPISTHLDRSAWLSTSEGKGVDIQKIKITQTDLTTSMTILVISNGV